MRQDPEQAADSPLRCGQGEGEPGAAEPGPGGQEEEQQQSESKIKEVGRLPSLPVGEKEEEEATSSRASLSGSSNFFCEFDSQVTG